MFDFTIAGCLISGKEIPKGDTFNPAMRRLVSEEKCTLIFDDDDYNNTNEFCLIRFSYKDIFGYQYYQDLPIVYIELECDGVIEHLVEIRDIKAPICEKDGVKCLEEAAKEYIDYNVLCLNCVQSSSSYKSMTLFERIVQHQMLQPYLY